MPTPRELADSLLLALRQHVEPATIIRRIPPETAVWQCGTPASLEADGAYTSYRPRAYNVRRAMPDKPKHQAKKKSSDHQRPDRWCCRTIVDEATALIDEHGIESCTMRELAGCLGIEAMSLYSHFANKDELLDSVVAAVISTIKAPPRSLPPRTRLVRLATQFRALGHAHPNIFPLIVLRPTRLDAAVWPVEIALDALAQLGLTDKHAVQAQRILLGFVRGYTMWELGGFATGRRMTTGRVRTGLVRRELQSLDETRFPRVRAVTEAMINFSPEREFRDSLEAVLDGVLNRDQAESRVKRAAKKITK